jgi:hypothetical protein
MLIWVRQLEGYNVSLLINKLFKWKKDPVKECKVFKLAGCSHVDGFNCDMDTCQILAKLELIHGKNKEDIYNDYDLNGEEDGHNL